jgi:F-type H+-transporting ATPase subunit a
LASPDRVDPIHQFDVYEIIPISIGGYDLSFTNSALFMVVTVVLSSLFLFLTTSSRGLVPGRAQSVTEVLYEFVAGMLRDAAGPAGMKFFPLVFALFTFILVANLLGMFPYFFTVTSHVVVTATLAVFVVGLVVVVGIAKHGLGWFKLFVPHGVPGVILPFISLIEIISFLSRPVSLGLRLFGNMLAGHIVLKVFAGFVVSLASFGFVGVLGSVAPLVMAVALTALEFLVAFLQAFVFAILTCVYLNDALHTHH